MPSILDLCRGTGIITASSGKNKSSITVQVSD